MSLCALKESPVFSNLPKLQMAQNTIESAISISSLTYTADIRSLLLLSNIHLECLSMSLYPTQCENVFFNRMLVFNLHLTQWKLLSAQETMIAFKLCTFFGD